MPNNVIKDLVNKSKKPEKEVEKAWNEAKNITSEEFNKKEKDFKDKEWAYTTSITKKLLGIKESYSLEEDSSYYQTELKKAFNSAKSINFFVSSDKGKTKYLPVNKESLRALYFAYETILPEIKSSGHYFNKTGISNRSSFNYYLDQLKAIADKSSKIVFSSEKDKTKFLQVTPDLFKALKWAEGVDSMIESYLKEEVDVKQIIKDLSGNFSATNEEQMKAVELLKGLALSDEELANNFMKELDAATTEIANKLLGSLGESTKKEILLKKNSFLQSNKSFKEYLNEVQISSDFSAVADVPIIPVGDKNIEDENKEEIIPIEEANKLNIAKGFLIDINRDANGNKVAKFITKNNKGFSIQTNGHLPILHKVSNIKDINSKDLGTIEKEVIAYITKYGTSLQKELL